MAKKNTCLESILTEYEQQKLHFEKFADKMEGLLTNLLANRVIYHSITARLKLRESLIDKVKDPQNKYSKLNDITDSVGLRIITYFEDDVDKVAEIIEKEFEIDLENSIDKRKIHASNQFGYLSLHYIVRLNSQRLYLTENNNYSNCKAEIQIRSILQHAWAEIEHDLGYKNKLAIPEIPRETKRSFYRLAGLLEIADKEFIRIRNSIKTYENELIELRKCINNNPKKVQINQTTLLIYITENKKCLEFDTRTNISRGNIVFDKQFIDNFVYKGLDYMGITTIYQLNSLIEQYSDKAIEFVELWLADYNTNIFRSGLSIVYLCLVITASSGSRDKVLNFLNHIAFLEPEIRGLEAEKIIGVYEKVISKL